MGSSVRAQSATMPDATTTRPAVRLGTSLPTSGPTTARAEDAYLVVRDIREVTRRRIVKSFDFDEQSRGNVESVPMYWQRYEADRFPHYLVGRFDVESGHESPPSFYLELKGGNLAYSYRAEDIPVHTQSDYQISVWIRPDRLKHARACASAFYSNRNGRQLPGTERFSRLIGGTGQREDWQQVTIKLPGGNAKARQIGIAVWVVQPPPGQGSGSAEHEIYRQDIGVGAWFDDIVVARLPRALLTTSQPGNVFQADQQAELRAEVSDPDGKDLTARVEVTAADGKKLLDRPVRVAILADRMGAEVVGLGRLPAGLYHGRLTVSTAAHQLSEHRIRFAQLGPKLNPLDDQNEGFGLVLAEEDCACPDATARLIGLLGAAQVKLPIEGPSLRSGGSSERTTATLDLLERLWRGHIDVTAILATVGGTDSVDPLDRKTRMRQSLLAALAENPETWRSHLGRPLTRHLDFVQSWQMGADEDEGLAWNPHLRDAMKVLRTELDRFLPSAETAVPWPLRHQPPAKRLEAQYVSLYIPNTVRAIEIAEYLRDYRKARPQGVWAVVEPLETGRYERVARLSDLAARLIACRAADVTSVYVPRPWEVTRDAGMDMLEPREEYIVVRTVAGLLNRCRYVSEVHLDRGVKAILFERDGSGVMALWDEQARPAGRELTLYLGAKPEQIDLWGRTRTPARTGAQHRIQVTRTPGFVRCGAVWPLKLRAGFSLTPSDVESSYRLHEPVVRFTNPRQTPISGTVRFKPPTGWEIRPTRVQFSLTPGQELRMKVTLRFPPNEVAGPKTLEGEFLIDSDRAYRVVAWAPFKLGLNDFVVRSHARVEGSTVVVQQTVTNRCKDRVDIEGYVMAPGRARMVRTYRQIEPGQTVLKRYILDNANRLIGRGIRVGLKEIRGPRLLNEVVVVQ